MYDTANEAPEKAILVGLQWKGNGDWDISDSLAELKLLAESAGAEVVAVEMQKRDHPDPTCFVGEGKARELAAQCTSTGAAMIVFDDELSPAQASHLEEMIPAKVIDRTGLILDIFAQRALSREGKIQVELAQLRYLLPRLSGKGTGLSRLGGGIGTRGPGETRLETDRRRIRQRIRELEHEINEVQAQREVQRVPRKRNELPLAVLVGYTNAGKSTLFNRLTDAGVLAEDKLFATLDPIIRRLKFSDGREILVADTVGFIQKLPHELVAAFRATLEEVRHADLLIHVADASHPQLAAQCASVSAVLEELNVADKPLLMVFNKIDRLSGRLILERLNRDYPGSVAASGLTGEGIDDLMQALASRSLPRRVQLNLLIPYAEAGVIAEVRAFGEIRGEEYRNEGIFVRASLEPQVAGRLKRFEIEEG